jgi:2-oxoglutarate dehydrogenase E2 component (dihydrolipoamide succinyltransferase)
MARFELVMPKMGESVLEATITKWHKKIGDIIQEDDAVAEIATDKVDSEIPSPVDGKLKEVFFKEGDVVSVGTVIAVIEMEGEEAPIDGSSGDTTETPKDKKVETTQKAESVSAPEDKHNAEDAHTSQSGKFFSPLVKTIARAENISLAELESLHGSGKDGRITKDDVLQYISIRQNVSKKAPEAVVVSQQQIPLKSRGSDTIEEMGRMRKLIADHMVNSVKTSAHVTSFIEVKMGKVVQWREKMKKQFELQYGEKLTYTHIILEAASRALLEFPKVNASVDQYNIIIKKNINIGMATALPDGNLIVPVIKQADQRNLLGLAREANRLADLARTNKLQADDITDGTFTFTNLGSFGSLTGTPIINQPQVAILGAGVIAKKPIVIETPSGDAIGIEPMMILSLSYDHRIVDGAMGGLYLKRVTELLENFDINRSM